MEQLSPADGARTLNDPSRADVLRRLRRVEGQIRGVHRMVEEARDCREVVLQLAAIKAAIASLNTLVAEQYATACLCGVEQVEAAEVARLLDVLKAAR